MARWASRKLADDEVPVPSPPPQPPLLKIEAPAEVEALAKAEAPAKAAGKESEQLPKQAPEKAPEKDAGKAPEKAAVQEVEDTLKPLDRAKLQSSRKVGCCRCWAAVPVPLPLLLVLLGCCHCLDLGTNVPLDVLPMLVHTNFGHRSALDHSFLQSVKTAGV